MKILLLHKGNKKDSQCTSENEQEQNEISIGLVSIFGILKENNFDVELINLSNYDWSEIEELIEEKKPDLVGIGCYTKNRFTVVKLAESVKKTSPQTKIVLGGPHASHLYQQILKNYQSIDLIVLGEGELTFLELVETIKEGKSIEGIKGIAYRNGEEIIKTLPREPIINLDSLPLATKYYPSKNLMTSRGCPGNCIFCCTPKLWGRQIRYRSAKNVVDELELMKEKGITDNIYFADDTFTVDKQRVIDICQEIIKRGLKITWYCNARVNFVCEERLLWMKKAGCLRISYGIESGSPLMLKNLQKYISVEQILNAAELTRKFGIHLRFYFITGTPGETEETVNETISVIEKAKPNEVTTCLMTVYPGTQLYQLAKEKGFIDDNIWLNDSSENILYTFENSLTKLTELNEKIVSYFNAKEKEFQYSVEEREHIKNLFPENSLAYLELAETYQEQGLFDSALDNFSRALALGANPSTANLGIAVALLMKSDYQQAIDFAQKALCNDQRIDGLVYKISGDAYFKLRDKEKAVEFWRQALKLDPTDERLKRLVGRFA